MSGLEIQLRVAGIALMALGLAHAMFPRYFKWHDECAQLNLLTRQVHFVHNGFIGLTVFLNGALCAFYAAELLEPGRLPHALLIGIGLFWLARLLVQLFVYRRVLWVGKRFETAVHIAFLAGWAYLSGLFLFAAYR